MIVAIGSNPFVRRVARISVFCRVPHVVGHKDPCSIKHYDEVGNRAVLQVSCKVCGSTPNICRHKAFNVSLPSRIFVFIRISGIISTDRDVTPNTKKGKTVKAELFAHGQVDACGYPYTRTNACICVSNLFPMLC